MSAVNEREQVEAWASATARSYEPEGCPCRWINKCPDDSLADCTYREQRISAFVLAAAHGGDAA
jgi:hypothetical protein